MKRFSKESSNGVSIQPLTPSACSLGLPAWGKYMR